MAIAQTKVTRPMKDILSALRIDKSLKHAEVFQDPGRSNYTAIVNPVQAGTQMRNASFVRISVAFQGAGEVKFKKKAGLYYAAQRADFGEGIVVQISDTWGILESMGLGDAEGKAFSKLAKLV